VNVNWAEEYTVKFACLYFKKCEREKQKTEIDCQIYKIRVKQDWLVNSFACNSFKGRKIVIIFFTIVSPLRLCNCVKKFMSLSLKLKAGKMKNPNWLPDLQKKKMRIKIENCVKNPRNASKMSQWRVNYWVLQIRQIVYQVELIELIFKSISLFKKPKFSLAKIKNQTWK
jgi:hypothetical protein